jgi:hypothetical protein
MPKPKSAIGSGEPGKGGDRLDGSSMMFRMC